MKIPITSVRRFGFLDSVEIFQARDYQQDFPLHFHDVLCLTLVQSGYECTEVEGKKLLSPIGSISLTYQEEIHANPNINDGSYSFLTYYLSPEVLRYFYGGKDFAFIERVVQDHSLFSMLYGWAQEEAPINIREQNLQSIIQYFVRHHIRPRGSNDNSSTISNRQLNDVLSYMNENLDSKITIEQLAKMADSDSFKFIRSFKKEKGITPIQYLTIKRVEKAKRLLKRGNTSVDTALSVGFYDQSHFTKNFKRLTGITPRVYQKACNILQD